MFHIIYKDYCFRLNLFSKMLRILLARDKRRCVSKTQRFRHSSLCSQEFSKMLRILLARNKRRCLFPIGSNFRVRIILHSVLKTLAGFCHSIGLYALTGSLGIRLDSTLPKFQKKRAISPTSKIKNVAKI